MLSKVAHGLCHINSTFPIQNAFQRVDNKRIFTLFGHQLCYSNIERVTEKHFPVISPKISRINETRFLSYPLCDPKNYPPKEVLVEYKGYRFNKSTGTFWKEVSICSLYLHLS